MQFKIKNTEVKISFSFFAILLISLISGTSRIYFCSLISALLHECIHMLFLYIFGASTAEFSLSIFGGNIKRETVQNLTNIKEAIISLSAPVTNIVIGVVTLFFFQEKSLWAIVNLCIGIFNLLPFYSFDGGRGLSYLLRYMFSERVTQCIVTVTSIITVVISSFFSVYIFFNYTRNYTLIVFVIYMIFCLIFRHKEEICIKKQIVTEN